MDEHTSPLPALMTVAEVAKALRVSKMTVYRMIHNQEIDVIKARGSFRISEEALTKYVDG